MFIWSTPACWTNMVNEMSLLYNPGREQSRALREWMVEKILKLLCIISLWYPTHPSYSMTHLCDFHVLVCSVDFSLPLLAPRQWMICRVSWNSCQRRRLDVSVLTAGCTGGCEAGEILDVHVHFIYYSNIDVSESWSLVVINFIFLFLSAFVIN